MEKESYYNSRKKVSKEGFFEKNKPAFFFWGIVISMFIFFIIPWLVGWYNIIF